MNNKEYPSQIVERPAAPTPTTPYALVTHMEKLEAKLAKAVEALRFLIEATTVTEANICITRALTDARAVLAELEKPNDI